MPLTRHYHQNNFATNVTSNQLAGVTTTPLNSIPSATAPFYIALDATNTNGHYEVVDVTSKTATNINHAATTYAHSTDEEVRMVVPAVEMDDISAALATGTPGADGWTSVSDTWTYASANTITVPSGAASLYQKGDKIKLTQSTGGTKYWYLSAVADTLLTLVPNTNYTLVNEAISSPQYSHQATPLNFPQWFAYTPTGPTSCTITGRYTIKGNTCRVIIRMAFTGGTTWAMPTLPIAASANIMGFGTYFFVGRGGYLDSGSANLPDAALVQIDDNGSTADIYRNITDPTVFSATSPITWANGDVLEVWAEYEI